MKRPKKKLKKKLKIRQSQLPPLAKTNPRSNKMTRSLRVMRHRTANLKMKHKK